MIGFMLLDFIGANVLDGKPLVFFASMRVFGL